MRPWRSALLSAWLLGLPAAPLHAQAPLAGRGAETGDPAEREIVVTGARGDLSDRIGAFVAAVTAETGNAQVARWDRRLCLHVEGLSPGQRDYIAGEIAAAGREVGLEIAGSGRCDGSAFVIFSADPDALLRRIGVTRPRFFGAIPAARRRELLAISGPVRWLSYAQLRGAEGEGPSSFHAAAISSGSERPVPALRTTPSRLTSGARMDLQSMVVLVDASRLQGVSNRSLAAYLTMVVLGNVRTDHGVAGSVSILGMFEAARSGTVVTEGLSEWDRAYLRALYSGTPNMPAAQRMQRIGVLMEGQLAAGPPGDPR
ncbi:MAG TPA: hypothetical protein VF702_14755 [Allosphingosinicella sp.]